LIVAQIQGEVLDLERAPPGFRDQFDSIFQRRLNGENPGIFGEKVNPIDAPVGWALRSQFALVPA
jgi:hypothetical protein